MTPSPATLGWYGQREPILKLCRETRARKVGRRMALNTRVISVNVGQPREVMYRGKTVVTGIFKEPVQGRVAVRTLNLSGDKQADLSVHGGLDKAVYAYPAEHYSCWQKQLGGIQLPYGAFGENITTEGLLEQDVSIGDQFRFGSAKFIVAQPRLPCYKLEIRFGRDDMIK